MIKLDQRKKSLQVTIPTLAASPAEQLYFYQKGLITVLKKALLNSEESGFYKEDADAMLDTLELLQHLLPDCDQLHRLELSRPELYLELQRDLSEIERKRIEDLKEIKRLRKELERDRQPHEKTVPEDSEE